MICILDISHTWKLIKGEILSLRKLITSVFIYSQNGSTGLYATTNNIIEMLNAFLPFLWLFTCLNGVFVHGESGFSAEKNTVYSLNVKMTGSNNETEEKGKIILSRETNILLTENQSERRK